jgi:hypothetical protein
MPDADGVLEVDEPDPENYDPDVRLPDYMQVPPSEATKASTAKLKELLAQRREKHPRS